MSAKTKQTRQSRRNAGPTDLTALIRQGRKTSMPRTVAPMLCTLTKTIVDDPEYLYEIKWDGYRILSYVSKKKARLDSRSAIDYTKRYPLIVKALQDLGHDAILDGEVVVFNEEGRPDFDALQLYNGHTTDISYCVFDILWLDGYDLMPLPLTTRKQILQSLIAGHPIFRFSESFDNGPELYERTQQLNLEGVIAKLRDSSYVPDQRANAWLKTPTRRRQEFVIGGWAESDKARSFRSLLFGAYNDGKFEWIGRSGGGYKQSEMPGILQQLKKLEIPKSPFVNKVLDTKGATIHWTQPKLVANFEFATWTKSGRIRKPATFLGFRKDKKPTQVVREIPKPIAQVEEEVHRQPQPSSAQPVKPAQPAKPAKPPKSSARSTSTPPPAKDHRASTSHHWRSILSKKTRHSATFDIGDCTIELTDVDREIWKGIPKARLIEYYHGIAPLILPYLKDRPQSLHIKPTNAGAEGFYIKDMEGHQPDCAEIYTDERRHPVKGKPNTIDYLVCNNEATLLWMINLGCIDINPWSSRRWSPETPDYIVIDLDPTIDNSDPTTTHKTKAINDKTKTTNDKTKTTNHKTKAINHKTTTTTHLTRLHDTVLATKAWCDRHKLKAFAKTSGQSGLHFYIPCTYLNYTDARKLAEHISAGIQALSPKSSTISTSITGRRSLVYIDPSQNDYADTLAAPYSVRPWHTPTISTPLEWKELDKQIDPSIFTIDNIILRIQKKGDLFRGVLDEKIAAANTQKLSRLIS